MDLIAAVTQGDVEHVDRLLALGIPPDHIDRRSGSSALHAAVLYNPTLLPILLEYTSNPDAPQVLGGTALSYAVHELDEKPDAVRRQQLFEAITVLLHAGANPRGGSSDQSALALARLYSFSDVEQLLLPGERSEHS